MNAQKRQFEVCLEVGEGALDGARTGDQHVVEARLHARRLYPAVSARKRRRTRLRTTAPPTFLDTVNPKRAGLACLPGLLARHGLPARTPPRSSEGRL